MSDNQKNMDDKPARPEDFWAQRRGKNIALLSVIMGLAVLFFVITIVKMG